MTKGIGFFAVFPGYTCRWLPHQKTVHNSQCDFGIKLKCPELKCQGAIDSLFFFHSSVLPRLSWPMECRTWVTQGMNLWNLYTDIAKFRDSQDQLHLCHQLHVGIYRSLKLQLSTMWSCWNLLSKHLPDWNCFQRMELRPDWLHGYANHVVT